MQGRIDAELARGPDVEMEADVVRRAMVLRKAGRIGILWAENGRFFISTSEFDPWGTRWPVSLAELLAKVEAAERKPVQSETSAKGCNSVVKCTR